MLFENLENTFWGSIKKTLTLFTTATPPIWVSFFFHKKLILINFYTFFQATRTLQVTLRSHFLSVCNMRVKQQKHPSRCVFIERRSEDMQQIYGRTPMPKCDFNKVASNFIEIALRHGCSPVNLLDIFRMVFTKNTSGSLLLKK